MVRPVIRPVVRSVAYPVSGDSGGIAFSWTTYWTTLISATVENAAPTNVVLTFPNAKPSLGASDFTIAGFTISSASWTGSVLTLVLSTAVLVFNEELVITFITTGQTAIVTNNVADDGGTVGWFAIGDGSATYMTKDGSNYVSKWNDLSGLGHHLLQETGADQPLYSETGLLFDGVSEMLSATPFTLNQPVYYYMVLSQKTWTNDDIIIEGNTSGGGMIRQITDGTHTNNIQLFSGTTLNLGRDINLNIKFILRAVVNGNNSSIEYNDETAVTGAVGATNIGGLKIGGRAATTRFSNIEVNEYIVRTSALADIYGYLKSKYNIS